MSVSVCWCRWWLAVVASCVSFDHYSSVSLTLYILSLCVPICLCASVYVCVCVSLCVYGVILSPVNIYSPQWQPTCRICQRQFYSSHFAYLCKYLNKWPQEIGSRQEKLKPSGFCCCGFSLSKWVYGHIMGKKQAATD